jgi:hypothetical protein
VTLENISLVEKVVGKNAEVVGTVNHPRQRTNLKKSENSYGYLDATLRI